MPPPVPPRSRPVEGFRSVPRLPGDKSVTHRAFLLPVLAGGETVVSGANPGADCEATRSAVARLGVTVTREGEDVFRLARGPRSHRSPGTLDLGNSGTGLRLLCGLLAGLPATAVLTGDASLQRRPVERVLAPLRALGARVEAPEGDHPPVRIEGGGPLIGAEVTLPVPSAQVKSALLLAGVQASGTTRIRGGGASRDHTERMLRAFGATVRGGADDIAIEGGQPLTGIPVPVPRDPSAAGFYLAALAAVPAAEVTLDEISLNPTRIRHFELFRRLGLVLETEETGTEAGEPRGRVRARGGSLSGIEIGPETVPGVIDELPALAVAAAFARGTTRVRGAGELRLKESDRLDSVADGLEAIGARVRRLPDGWEIEGSAGSRLSGGTVAARGDHRVAMAFLAAGLGCREGVAIHGEPMIETSDPYFLWNLNRIMEGTA